MSIDNFIIGLGILFGIGLVYVTFLINQKIKCLRTKEAILGEVPQESNNIEDDILPIQQQIKQVNPIEEQEQTEILKTLVLERVKLEVQRYRLESKSMEIRVIEQISDLILSGHLPLSDLYTGLNMDKLLKRLKTVENQWGNKEKDDRNRSVTE